MEAYKSHDGPEVVTLPRRGYDNPRALSLQPPGHYGAWRVGPRERKQEGPLCDP